MSHCGACRCAAGDGSTRGGAGSPLRAYVGSESHFPLQVADAAASYFDLRLWASRATYRAQCIEKLIISYTLVAQHIDIETSAPPTGRAF